MPGLSAALLFLAGGPAGEPPLAIAMQESTDVEVVQGQTDPDDRMTIPVRLDGKGPFRFLIDTGSQRTVVSTALAARLGLQTGPQARVIGVAGESIVQTARIEEIELGTRSFFDITVPLLEQEHMGAAGIVGTDSLQDQRVLLDFTRETMAIGDARSLGGNSGYEIVVRARRRSGRLIMTHATLDGVRAKVILDTGASTSVGNRALQRALRKRGNPAATVTLHDVNGNSIRADLGFGRQLKIDGFTIVNLVIAFTDTPAFAELDLVKRPALFLGMRELRLFKRIAVDFQTRRVMFDLPAEQ